LARPFDLEKKSREFKTELDELLNCTVCKGISLKSVPSTMPERTVVGYRITKVNQDVTEGIPIMIGSDPRFCPGLSIRLAPDDQPQHLMVTSSVMILATAADVADESNLLLHYDYERGNEIYLEAPLQVCASSDAWREAGRRLDGKERLLEGLHLPVDDRRFRPTLEDVVEFLIREQLAEAHSGWEKVLEKSRRGFRDKQLKAAVRRRQEVAIAELERLGYRVKPPRK
jgi:hypothetical protein